MRAEASQNLKERQAAHGKMITFDTREQMRAEAFDFVAADTRCQSAPGLIGIERAISVNITAQGGDPALLNLSL